VEEDRCRIIEEKPLIVPAAVRWIKVVPEKQTGGMAFCLFHQDQYLLRPQAALNLRCKQ
jgi:hypothetical protein